MLSEWWCTFSNILSFYLDTCAPLRLVNLHGYVHLHNYFSNRRPSQPVVHTITWWPSISQNGRLWQNITEKTKNRYHIYRHHLYVYHLSYELSCTQQRENNGKQLNPYLNKNRLFMDYILQPLIKASSTNASLVYIKIFTLPSNSLFL